MSDPLFVRDVLAQLQAFETGEEVAIAVHTGPEKQETFRAGQFITREYSSGRAIVHVDTTKSALPPFRTVQGGS